MRVHNQHLASTVANRAPNGATSLHESKFADNQPEPKYEHRHQWSDMGTEVWEAPNRPMAKSLDRNE